MTIDKDSPQIVAYRLEMQEKALAAVEGKVDSLHTKFDKFRTEVIASQCPQPGSCVQLIAVADRLEKNSAAHLTRIESLERTAVETRNFVKGAVWVAGGVAAFLSFIAPAAFAAVKTLFVSKP